MGVHQVGVDREVSEQAAVGQCKGADTAEGGGKSPKLGDLLVEGEEQEYFLELLMRRASPEQPKGSLPTRSEATPPRIGRPRAKEREPVERTQQGRQLTKCQRRKER